MYQRELMIFHAACFSFIRQSFTQNGNSALDCKTVTGPNIVTRNTVVEEKVRVSKWVIWYEDLQSYELWVIWVINHTCMRSNGLSGSYGQSAGKLVSHELWWFMVESYDLRHAESWVIASHTSCTGNNSHYIILIQMTIFEEQPSSSQLRSAHVSLSLKQTFQR